MKIILNKAVNAYQVIDRLNNDTALSFKIHYWCMRNSKALIDSVLFFQNERDKLCREYAKTGEDIFIKSEDNQNENIFNIKDDSLYEEFYKKLNELLNMECDIEPYKIDAEYLFSQPTFNVSGQDIFQIDFLIDDPTTK